MPRFKVVKQITAVYRETYLVDASSGEEAERLMRSGGVRSALRTFHTTPGVPQPAGHVAAFAPTPQPIVAYQASVVKGKIPRGGKLFKAVYGVRG